MLCIKTCQQLALPCSSFAMRCMSSLPSLLGASTDCSSLDSSRAPERSIPPAEDHGSGLQQQQPGMQPPTACGEPKNKLSLHRRGNRRISYYAKRQELFAHCKHCGIVGLPHQYFPANPQCSGQCLQPPTKTYPKEYKPPC